MICGAASLRYRKASFFVVGAARRLELIKQMVTRPNPPGDGVDAVEAALRHLGTRNHGIPLDLIRYAIDRPQSATGQWLVSLTAPTGMLAGWTSEERASALWRILQEGIEDPDVGPTPQSRRRRALHAALRVPDSDIDEPWGSSLTERFRQLKALRAVFGDPTTTQPMEFAWKRGVKALGAYVERRLGELQTSDDWEQYRPSIQSEPSNPHGPVTPFRPPSPGAQPIFVDLFITTVFMKRRAVYRRITERLVTARVDGVAFYTARGFAGKSPRLTYVPVHALWGCHAEFIESPRAGRPAVTRLWFPSPLQAGDQAHFASEVIDENITEERTWIDVDIDHHGIPGGATMYGHQLPVCGLTIRVRFDEGHVPETVWWYAESNESERYDPPVAGDHRLLTIVGNDVQHTFANQCQPRESYGLAFKWPAS